MKTSSLFKYTLCCVLSLTYSISALAHDYGHDEDEVIEWDMEAILEHSEDDFELLPDLIAPRGCTKASASQLATVNQGNKLREQFIAACKDSTGNTTWCEQAARPNPASKNTFYCTYGNQQPHMLIHPTSSTWKNAIKAVELLNRLKSQGICVSHIYNWWRPEPYNKNVGGAAGRHPFGTSVDVRFCTNSDAIKAFDKLCGYRKQGEVRALGYYGSTGVHIGVGDSSANTWGRNCR